MAWPRFRHKTWVKARWAPNLTTHLAPSSRTMSVEVREGQHETKENSISTNELRSGRETCALTTQGRLWNSTGMIWRQPDELQMALRLPPTLLPAPSTWVSVMLGGLSAPMHGPAVTSRIGKTLRALISFPFVRCWPNYDRNTTCP